MNPGALENTVGVELFCTDRRGVDEVDDAEVVDVTGFTCKGRGRGQRVVLAVAGEGEGETIHLYGSCCDVVGACFECADALWGQDSDGLALGGSNLDIGSIAAVVDIEFSCNGRSGGECDAADFVLGVCWYGEGQQLCGVVEGD